MKLIIELILIGYLTNFILCQPPPYANYTDLLFNMITNYLEGMSDSGEHKCSDRWKYKNNTNIIKEIMRGALEQYEKGDSIEAIASKYALPFITIKRLGENCRLLNAFPIFMDLLNGKLMQKVLYHVGNYTREVYGELKNATDDNSRYRIIGKIIANITKFYVK